MTIQKRKTVADYHPVRNVLCFTTLLWFIQLSCIPQRPINNYSTPLYDHVFNAVFIDSLSEESFTLERDTISSIWQHLDSMGYFPQSFISQANGGLDPEEHQYTDRGISARFAYGKKGIYILFTVLDDEFGKTITPNWWANDCIDFCIDTLSAKKIYKNSLFLCKVAYSGLTRSSVQFQARFTRNGLDSIAVNRVVPTASKKSDSLAEKKYTIDQARSKLDINLSVTTIDPLRRCQQWFIPWSAIYQHPLKPTSGSNLALTLCYNDIDSGDTKCAAASIYGMGGPFQSGAYSWTTLQLDENKIKPMEIISLDSVHHFNAMAAFGQQLNILSLKLYRDIPDFVTTPPLNPENFAYGVIWIDGKPFVFATSKIPDRYKRTVSLAANKKPDSIDLWNPSIFILDRNHNFSLADDTPNKWEPFIDTNHASSQKFGLNQIYDSVACNGYTVKVHIMSFKSDRNSLAMERLDGMQGSMLIDNHRYKAAFWYPNICGFGILTDDIYWGIDGNKDGVINLKHGSNELLKGSVTKRSAFNQIHIKTIDFEKNRFFVDSVLTLNTTKFELCEGSNCFNEPSLINTKAIKTVKSWCSGESLVVLYFYQNTCSRTSKIERDSTSPPRIIKTMVDKFIGPCLLVGVQKGLLTTQKTNNGIVSYEESRDEKKGLFSVFNASAGGELICIDRNGVIVYRGQEFLMSALSRIWSAKHRTDYELLRPAIINLSKPVGSNPL